MQQRGRYYFHEVHLYGPRGNTGVYISWNGEYGYLYSRKGYTRYYLLNDYIYGPRGYTHLYLQGNAPYKYIYGSGELPFLDD
jgi:hypothetical protein